MTEKIDIRESTPSDIARIEEIYPSAFPDEDLLPVVRGLLQETSVVLSLVATIGTNLVGHIIFTTCSIAGNTDKVALLGPLAVAPDWQRQNVGDTLVRTGLKQLEDAGVVQIHVLGDPNYYGRFGFIPEDSVEPPYPLPDPLPSEWHGAWQSIKQGRAIKQSRADPFPRGKLSVPQPWRQPELWAP